VSAKETWSHIAGFWEILEQNLSRRHGASPLHSLEEIRMLHDRFPDDILLMAAEIGGLLVGGIVLFLGGPVMKAQYTATTEEGRSIFALDPITEQAIDLARERGCRFFDFGTATGDEGRSLSQDLYQFKVSFGAGGVVYEQYEAELQ
jgi:lipid II:glycine glycyltransferase (peptidoglycan interpeptide bridge formation enzyme)